MSYFTNHLLYLNCSLKTELAFEHYLFVLQETPLVFITKTLSFKVKENCYKFLNKCAREVNYTWNYSNAICRQGYDRTISKGDFAGKRYWVSEFELNNLTSGSTKHAKNAPDNCFQYIPNSTIQMVNRQLCHSRNQFSKYWLKFRKSSGSKKSLGWVPFKEEAVSIKKSKNKKSGVCLMFAGKSIRIFNEKRYLYFYNLSKATKGTGKHKEYVAKMQAGSFAQNALGEWFFNQTVTIPYLALPNTRKELLGIDPNCKNIALSNGEFLDFRQWPKKQRTHQNKEITNYEKLALLQRNGHKKQTKRLHAKIKNQRNDAIHKATKKLVEEYDSISHGDLDIKLMMMKEGYTARKERKKKNEKKKQDNRFQLNSKKEFSYIKNEQQTSENKRGVNERIYKKPSFGNSLSDQAISSFRNVLASKSHWAGREFRVTNEYNTTRACSNCDQLTGPRGLRQLVVRNWICSACNTEHQRDTNSAKNQSSAPVSRKYVSSFEPRYRLLLAGTIQNVISPSGQVNNTTVSQTWSREIKV